MDASTRDSSKKGSGKVRVGTRMRTAQPTRVILYATGSMAWVHGSRLMGRCTRVSLRIISETGKGRRCCGMVQVSMETGKMARGVVTALGSLRVAPSTGPVEEWGPTWGRCLQLR